VDGEISLITSGSVTAPEGFLAGASHAGLKKSNALDIAILCGEDLCTGAALFTTNAIKSAPVVLSQRRINAGKIYAVVINSGCANSCVGEDGLTDASNMTKITAAKLGVPEETVLVASTGVIGKRLPMDLIKNGIEHIKISRDGGHDLARAIMTTDTVPKEAAVKVSKGEGQYIIGGAAKGSGMIHPDLATFLCFLTTDAYVPPEFLNHAIKEAADLSFNMLSIDTDTSTNDTLVILASGMAKGIGSARDDREHEEIFQAALNRLCIHLARDIARDGEGANRLIEVNVIGASRVSDARRAAKTIVSSPLVKTAIHGKDPNWGRIMAAVGRSGIDMVESMIDLYFGDICLVKAGIPVPFNKERLLKIMEGLELKINLDLNFGTAKATAWGCDLSSEYVNINSKYTT
jgi:glutamate N-acetyltransferase/amino-acid N-acetyltransferase